MVGFLLVSYCLLRILTFSNLQGLETLQIHLKLLENLIKCSKTRALVIVFNKTQIATILFTGWAGRVL